MVVRAQTRKLLYLTLITLIFVAVSSYYLFTPFDLTKHKDFIIPFVEDAIHAGIELEALTLTILPYPHISLTNLDIRKDNNTILKAKTVKASLVLRTLLFNRKFEVKSLIIVTPEVYVIREGDGGLNMLKILKEPRIPLSLKRVRIKTGKINFLDEFLPGKARYELSEVDATLTPKGIADFNYSGTAKLLPSSKIKFSGETKDIFHYIDGMIEVRRLHIRQALPYFRAFVSKEGLTGDFDVSLNYKIYIKPLLSDSSSNSENTFGKIDIRGVATYNEFTVSIPVLFERPVFSQKGIAHIDVSYSGDFLNIGFSKIEIHMPEFAIAGNLTFDRKKGSKEKVTITLDTSPIPLATIREQFFVSLLPDAMRQRLNQTSFHSGEIKLSDFKITGNTKDIRQLTHYQTPDSLFFSTEIKDAEFAHEGFAQTFSSVNGKVRWREGNLTLHGITGRYGKSVLEKLEGNINEILNAPSVNLKGYTLMDASELLDEFKRWSYKKMLFKEDMEKMTANGISSLVFGISGQIGREDTSKDAELNLSASLDATSVDITYLPWLQKKKGFNAAIDAKFVAKASNIFIETAKLKLGASEVNMNGMIKSNEDFSYKLNIMASDTDVGDISSLTPYFEKRFLLASLAGKISTNLEIDRKGSKNPLKLKGNIALKNGLFETEMLPKRMSNVDMTARFYGSSATVVIDSFKIGISDFSGAINIPDISSANIGFDIISPYLDSEDIYLSRKETKGTDMRLIGKGKLSVKSAKIRDFHIESFQSDILLKPDTILIKATFINNDGKVLSNFIYSRGQGDAFLWRLNLDASKVELESFINEAGARENILAGEAGMKVELVARKGEEVITRRIDGKCEVSAKKGRLWKFVWLSKIFSIVNIISIDELFREGLPYRTLTGNFQIKDGIISTENLLLESDSMRMSMIGTANITDTTIDAKLGLHPFVTVDKIVTKIPLAGWIIGGKEKSVISMYYTIKGPIKNPDVEAIPIRALGEGVWGIFKRILRLPLDAVEPLVE